MLVFIPKYATATVPRYTSYPPATQFSEEINEGHYRVWLETIGPNDSISIYIHIPFCHALCWYCGCHTTVPNRDERITDYVKALKDEVRQVARLISRSAKVKHIHFGGGTPNALPAATLANLIDLLHSEFSFHRDTELAVEVDPRHLTDKHISVLTGYQFKTRVSLGVQDVSEDVQALINRPQPFETVRSAVHRLRSAGISNINMDLLYGLPGQTEIHVRKSATMCVELQPDRLAVFGYAHVPWFKKHQKAIDESLLPSGAERLQQSEAIASELSKADYVPIGLDHFAKPGDALQKAQKNGQLRRNFQGYTVDPANVLIGFGASSIGTFNAGYVQNEPHLGRYKQALNNGHLPIARGVLITDHDRCIRAVIERLMCDFKVDLNLMADGFDRNVFSDALAALKPLQDDGLVEVADSVVEVTALGRPYIRNIAACFDAYHVQTSSRYSKAI